MSNLINKLWRYDPQVNDFELFGTKHISILIIILSIVVIMYVEREKLKNIPQKPLEILLAIVMITPRILLYFWYGTYETSLQEILPLYLCRVTIICTAYTLFTGKDNVRFITYFWGMFGSIAALFFADTSGYTFPHIMFISFFVGHGALAIIVFYMIFIRDYSPDYNEFKRVMLWTVAYILLACFVNKLVGGNYNYLEQNPPAIKMSKEFVNSIFYKFFILGSFLTINCLQYLPIHLKRRKEDEFQRKIA